ncbi:hypothetical protein G7Y89_g15617 [Cudoniella acicularis]|uniref:Uncharacterized protein n=1 Tax=Cudoniella acicularis TaxID=354080 RepID=A0A8H4QKL7_9HELO|nr:hypothetical protein G7Y89_g15617 [Cudoniella acicularis]
MGAFDAISQIYPPKPKFTEKDLPDLKGKVYIVTGSNTGVGAQLARILYSSNATVYIAARSEPKSLSAISSIRSECPSSTGQLTFLHLDLADLSTIKASANEFLAKEKKTKCPFQQRWCDESASRVKNCAGPVGGIPFDNLDYHKNLGGMHKYGISKAGNYLQATEFAKRFGKEGIVSVPLNPGNLSSDLYRHQGTLLGAVLKGLVLHPPVMGAYTELFAGLSPEVTIEKSGEWIVPWGRFMKIRKDLLEASKSEKEGGSGIAERFWEWNEEQIKDFVV